MNDIDMGGGNPIKVDKYSYKTEFQDRGAGHIHGTLWVKLHSIEKLCKMKEDESLVTLTKMERKDLNGKFTEPFKGIRSAFQKFRREELLDRTGDEQNAIVNFIDEFTTVSLCKDLVGEEVAKLA